MTEDLGWPGSQACFRTWDCRRRAYGAYVGEVLAPLMLIIGFYARIGAVLMTLNMLFAIGLAHSKDLFVLSPSGAWALELQGFFLACSVALALIGPGRYSINRR